MSNNVAQSIETLKSSYEKLHREIQKLFKRYWHDIKNGKLEPKSQKNLKGSVHYKKDFERIISLKARTEAVAKHLTEYMKNTDRFAKTIVFCVDQEHAEQMRMALNNFNSDIVREYPDYVVRVVSEEGKIGRGHLEKFMDIETRTPVIVTTSKLLTTGVDVPMCKNIVIFRVINSMTEFKQIIGRGTRVRDDYGKLYISKSVIIK